MKCEAQHINTNQFARTRGVYKPPTDISREHTQSEWCCNCAHESKFSSLALAVPNSESKYDPSCHQALSIEKVFLIVPCPQVLPYGLSTNSENVEMSR